MAYELNHIHLKAPDPEKTANWYVQAFNFRIISNIVRASGDRFVRCETPDGITVNITGARNNEPMGDGSADPHWGLEHIGFNVGDVDAELRRLIAMGAKLMEGPLDAANGARIAFINGPDDTRIELVRPAPQPEASTKSPGGKARRPSK